MLNFLGNFIDSISQDSLINGVTDIVILAIVIVVIFGILVLAFKTICAAIPPFEPRYKPDIPNTFPSWYSYTVTYPTQVKYTPLSDEEIFEAAAHIEAAGYNPKLFDAQTRLAMARNFVNNERNKWHVKARFIESIKQIEALKIRPPKIDDPAGDI